MKQAIIEKLGVFVLAFIAILIGMVIDGCTTSSANDTESYHEHPYLKTVSHEGHLYVLSRNGQGITHSGTCPCRKTK